MTRVILFIILVMLAIDGCTFLEPMEMKSYYKHLADPQNGLTKERSIGGLNYQLRYMPPELLASISLTKEQLFKGRRNRVRDSLVDMYKNSLTFLLTIEPSAQGDFDVTRRGVSSYEEFAGRVEKLSFNAKEWIELESADSLYKPAIVQMEGINNPGQHRNFIIVFAAKTPTGREIVKDDMCLIYSDELFETGISRFHFRADDLSAVPQLKL